MIENLLVLSRTHTSLDSSLLSKQVQNLTVWNPGLLSSPEQLNHFDAVMVLGSLDSAPQALQVGGVLHLALPNGLCVIHAPGTAMGEADWSLLYRLVPELRIQDVSSPRRLTSPKKEFSRYLALFGIGQFTVTELPEDAEVLGWMDLGDKPHPAAFFREMGRGGLYCLPFQHVGDHHPVLAELLEAVGNHWAGRGQRGLPYAQSLTLPGEDEIQRNIDDTQEKLEQLEEEASSLRSFHQLVGTASGDPFEKLCIRALNRIFDGSPYSAEDRPEAYAEDFWIIEGSEDLFLVEAKGVGTNIRREHVNQVDNHREGYGRTPDDLPGVLVVNVFRNAADLESRQAAVSMDVVAAAVRQNVLVMRSWDLFQLLSRSLSGSALASELVKLCSGGGGWLRVEAGSLTLVT